MRIATGRSIEWHRAPPLQPSERIDESDVDVSTSNPQFTGTYREFHIFIGPYLRNVIQTLTRGPKATAGACQHCGGDAPLDAAHVHGHDRPTLTRNIIQPVDEHAQVTVDLAGFMEKFRNAHDPIEKSILFLCRPCHLKYDQSSKSGVRRGRPPSAGGDSNIGGSLPITLAPAHPEEFKRALLDRKLAHMEIKYADGRVESKPWNAQRFSASSNVFGNLRSRPEFRSGAWQAKGIVALHVRVENGVDRLARDV